MSLVRFLENKLLLLLAWIIALVSRLLGASFWRLLGAARRISATAQWLLHLATPEGLAGTFRLGHTVAGRVRALLEHSATLSVTDEPLNRRLQDVPAPVAAYLRYALADLPPSATYRLAHIKLSGHFRFLPGSSASRGGSWHTLSAECYLNPCSPGYVWSATVQLGPFSWVRGFASFLQGAGSMQWKLCSPLRMRDLDQSGAAALGQASLAAFLAEAPCCPMALLPSRAIQWRALTDSSAEAVVSHCGAEAAAVFHFNRAGQITKMCSPAHGGANRGAGRVAGSSMRTAGSPACSTWYYRRYAQHCGMQVPTELEACWQLAGGEYSYAHMDMVQLTAWQSLEMMQPHTG